MSPSAIAVVDRLDSMARHLRAADHPDGDWWTEVVALVRTGVSLDAAVGWAGFAPVLRARTQTEALTALVDTIPAGTVTAVVVHRHLTARHPEGPAAAYLAVRGPTSLRSIHRRLAALRAANAAISLAGPPAV